MNLGLEIYFQLGFQAIIPEILDSTIVTDKNDKCSEIVFKAILNYCVKNLQIQSDSSLAELGESEDEDVYCTILYNDETHTFEQVCFKI